MFKKSTTWPSSKMQLQDCCKNWLLPITYILRTRQLQLTSFRRPNESARKSWLPWDSPNSSETLDTSHHMITSAVLCYVMLYTYIHVAWCCVVIGHGVMQNYIVSKMVQGTMGPLPVMVSAANFSAAVWRRFLWAWNMPWHTTKPEGHRWWYLCILCLYVFVVVSDCLWLFPQVMKCCEYVYLYKYSIFREWGALVCIQRTALNTKDAQFMAVLQLPVMTVLGLNNDHSLAGATPPKKNETTTCYILLQRTYVSEIHGISISFRSDTSFPWDFMAAFSP